MKTNITLEEALSKASKGLQKKMMYSIDLLRKAEKLAHILWQLAGLCKTMCWTLEDVAQANLDKLASRQQRGVIDGNGDHR